MKKSDIYPDLSKVHSDTCNSCRKFVMFEKQCFLTFKNKKLVKIVFFNKNKNLYTSQGRIGLLH